MKYVASGGLKLEGGEIDFAEEAVNFTSRVLLDVSTELQPGIHEIYQARLARLAYTLSDLNLLGGMVAAKSDKAMICKNYVLDKVHAAWLLNCLQLVLEDHPFSDYSTRAGTMFEDYRASLPRGYDF